MNRKSQIAVIDLTISLFIATIIIIFITFAWNRNAAILNENADYKEMQVVAFQAIDMLVRSEGSPSSWEENPSSARAIGLASSDRNISEDKLNSFTGLSYSNASQALGTELYDFYFQLKDINGTSLYSCGKAPDNLVVNVQRLALYKNETAIVEFALWK
ncbi:hypothetical protein KY358_05865 [Candidatus Woesearchaeota archaeon]|nr:hypothetical protein [Candidatus Woesearchaeota archaeon]